MSSCQSVYRPGNDRYQCIRCGYYWDRGEETPRCKTNDELGRETLDELKKEVHGDD